MGRIVIMLLFVIIFEEDRYTDRFCETILLEIAIAPVALYANNNVCNGTTANVLPALTGLGVPTTLPYQFPAGNMYPY